MNRISRIILTAGISLMLGTTCPAQELYNEVLKQAEAVVNNPKADEVSLKINHFKSTALRYLKNTALKKMETVTVQFLDTQAYYLSEFVGNYITELVRMRNDDEKTRKARILDYVNATVNNPLFEEADTEMTESFIVDKDGLTPFSINTNWERACQALKDPKKSN